MEIPYFPYKPGTGEFVGGTGNFGGSGSYTTILFAEAMPNTDYKVNVTAVAESSQVGEVWISDKTVNSFRVNNTGAGKTDFEWSAEVF